MYNAITWFTNSLYDIFSSKTDCRLGQEFKTELSKDYKNYNSAVILDAAPEYIKTMDVEIQRKRTKAKAISRDDKYKESLISEKGDVLKGIERRVERRDIGTPPEVTRHRKKTKTAAYGDTDLRSQCLKEHSEQMQILQREREQEDISECFDIFKAVGKRSSFTNLHNLMDFCPPPQNTVTHAQMRKLQMKQGPKSVIAEQESKIQNSMDRLQAVMRRFKCTQNLKKDIDFLVTNVGPAIAKAEFIRQLEQAPPLLRINKTDKK